MHRTNPKIRVIAQEQNEIEQNNEHFYEIYFVRNIIQCLGILVSGKRVWFHGTTGRALMISKGAYDLGYMIKVDKRNLVFNSLATGKCDSDRIVVWPYRRDFVFKGIPRNLTYESSALVQVMSWCRQERSHCLSKSWPRSMSRVGVNRPQWVE